MIKIIKRFRILLDKRQKNRLFILSLITLGGAFWEVLGVSLMIPMVTAIMQPDIIYTNTLVRKVCEIFNLHSHKTFVLLCLLFLIFIFAIKNLYLLMQYYFQARFVYNNRFVTQKQLLHAFMCRPYDYYLSVDSGEIMRNINGDVQETYNVLMTLLSLFTESIVSFALLITVFVVDHIMTTSIIIMMTVIVLVIIKIIKPILASKGKESRSNEALCYRWILQAVQGIKEVKIGNKEKFFEANFDEAGIKMVSAIKWQSMFNNAPRLLIEAGCVCSTLAVIGLMIYNGKSLEALFPSLAAFAMAAIKLLPSANRIINTVNNIAFHEPAVEKLINNLKNIEISKEEKSENNNKLSIKDKIELKDIVYCYPNNETRVLDGACMVVPIGKSVGVIGKSGAGKTTAIDVMLGLLTPKSGVVTTDGVDIQTNYPDLLSHIGYIPQSIFMLNGTIRDNITFGSVADDTQVWNALEEAQLASFVRELPKQLDTEIGERGIRISGGQRQRIGIARALYNNPDILVFDEATSSLDGETEAAIMESINRLHGKKTMIIIAHRLQTIEGCDIVYRVSDGKIIEEKKNW